MTPIPSRRWWIQCLTLAAAMALTACGGGRDTEAPQAAMASATHSATAAPVVDMRRRALAEGSMLQFQIQFMSLFDEAQAAYPQFFGHLGPTQTAGRYTYRHDATTGNYLALTDTEIVLMGPVVDSLTNPVTYARLDEFCAKPEQARYCGMKQVRRVDVGGLMREFIVYVPWRSRQATALPAVFMLHGTSGDGERFYAHSGWREKADETGLVAVFPSALWHCFFEDEDKNGSFDGVTELKVITKWAAGKLGDPAVRPLCTAAQVAALPADKRSLVDHPLADDMAFFRQMISDLTANFNVDPKRVYVSGFSNGAEMSSRLAAEASTQFAAAAAAASVVAVDTVAARPMSMIWSVGELDPEQSVALGYPNGVIPLTAELGTNPRFLGGVEQPFTRMLSLSPAKTHSQLTAFDTLISHFAYRTRLGAATNTFDGFVIQGLDHQYPNGKNHPVRMADVLWAFFETKSLP